ncbi:MAG: hypothetical protein U0167_10055 [bacterium]
MQWIRFHSAGATKTLLAASLALASCADLAKTRDVRVTIVDENNHPLPGAIFYVEAVENGKPFAFLWARAGLAGEVPQSAREPLKVSWRRGARLAMAAFAPGRRPAVLRETTGAIDSDGAVLELDPGPAWNPDLAQLAYPFQTVPDLAARLREPAAAPLVEAFRSAWAAKPDSTSTPAAHP